MVQQATINVTGSKTYLPGLSLSIGPFQIVNPNSGSDVSEVACVLGVNTINVPTTFPYVGVIIIPPALNTASPKLGGVGADSGIQLAPSSPQVLTFPATPPTTTSFTLTFTALPSGPYTFLWF